MVTVSIVTYHTDLEELARCLDSLNAQSVSLITVVDNASEERMRRFVADRGDARLRYIASENRGYGAGHNQALRQALSRGSRYHLVLNSDVRFPHEALEEMVRYMDAHPATGLAHPLLVYPDGRRQYTARAIPTPFDLIVRRFLPAGLFAKSRDRYLLKHADLSAPFEAGYVQGSFMLMRVEALRRSGLFDERFFMYPEDIDLSRRIGEVARVECVPAVTVIHDHRGASYHSGRMLRIHIINMVRYFCKWGWLFDRRRREVNRRLG